MAAGNCVKSCARGEWPGKPITRIAVGLLVLAANTIAQGQTSSGIWLAQGPAPMANAQVQNIIPTNPACGAIQVVVAHPTNTNLLYIGSVNGGIWRTTNGTSLQPTWQPLTDFLPSLSIGALAFDPTDAAGRVIIAGVGCVSSIGYGGALTGLLLSTNGGDSWTQIGQPTLVGENISSVAARGNLILAASENIWGGGNGSGLFRSTNGGANFQLVSGAAGTGLPAGPVSDLAGDAGNLFYCALRQTGIFRSDDAGAHWLNVTANITNIVLATDKVRVAVHNSPGTNVVYAGVADFDWNTYGDVDTIYRSTNMGVSWSVMGTPGANPGGQAYIQFTIAADPADPNVVYVGGAAGPLFRGDASLPAGSQFTSIVGGSAAGTAPHVDSRCLLLDAAGDLIETDDGGIYRRSSPRSSTGSWTSVIGNLQLAEFDHIAYDHNAHIIIGGTQDNGTVQQFFPGSQVWDTVEGGDGGDVAVDDTSEPGFSIRYVSASALNGFQRITYDAGNHFVSNAVPSLTVVSGNTQPSYLAITPVVLNNIDPRRLIIGTGNDIYESYDQGNTMGDIAAGFQVNVDSWAGTPIAYGGVSDGVTNANVLYVCTGDFVRVRTTGGLAATPARFPGSQPHAVVMDPNDWQTAYVLGDTIVCVTTNTGGSWSDITGNLTGVGGLHCEDFVSGPGGGAVVVGTDRGIYISFVASLGSWSQLGSSLPNAPVYDVHYDSVDEVVAAGTLGRGAWLLPNISAQFVKVLRATLSPLTSSNGFFSFQLHGLIGSNYVTQVSSDLRSWSPLTTNGIPAAGYVIITDPAPANQARRFYRAISP